MTETKQQQARGIGGRFAKPADLPPLAPKGPRWATAQLERLQKMRDANGGLLVEPPVALEELARARMVAPSRAGATELVRNEQLEQAMAWFTRIVYAGGSDHDLELAWSSWSPTALPSPKPIVRAEFEALKDAAGAKYAQLLHEADMEDLPRRILQDMRDVSAGLSGRMAELDRQKAPLLAKLRAHEARIAAFTEEHPWLKGKGH